MRIGIGIGRPQARDSDVVASYVLSNFTQGNCPIITALNSKHLQRSSENWNIMFSRVFIKG